MTVTKHTVPRAEVLAAVEAERRFMGRRCNAWTIPPAGHHEVSAWLDYMDRLLSAARCQLEDAADPSATERALHAVRRITAMGVACMEQHGAPGRDRWPG